MTALFTPGSRSRYAVTYEESRYGHAMSITQRLFDSRAAARAYAEQQAQRWDGLAFTVVEVVPLETIEHKRTKPENAEPSLFAAHPQTEKQ